MPINFSNATLLSSSFKNEFFGEVFRYRAGRELSIKGLVTSLTNTNGVSGILTGIAALESGANNWDKIVINGYDFGSGVIDSFTFDEGRDVQYKTYTVNIRTSQSGDYSSLTQNSAYSGLSFENFDLVRNFSESTTLDNNLQREIYNQSIKFSIEAPYTLDSVLIAKKIASGFFNNNYLTGVLGSKYKTGVYRKFYTESYDDVNNNFEFSNNFEISTGSNGVYSLYRSHVLNYDSAGVSKITEKADYLAHTDTPFITVSQQANTDITQSYSRCSGFFNAYKQNGEAVLIATPTERSITTNPYKGSLSYSINYTNSASLISNGFWDYSIDIDQSQGGVFNAEEKGEILGIGHVIDQKYNNALSVWASVQPNISGRVSNAAYYNSFPKSGHSTLRLASDSIILNQVEGRISYSQKYSDQTSILSSTNIRKANMTVTKDNNRKLATSFFIPGKKEILQVQPNLLPNILKYSVKMNGRSDVDINTYLTAAKSYLPVIGTDESRFISECDYSYNPYERNFVLNTTITSLPNG